MNQETDSAIKPSNPGQILLAQYETLQAMHADLAEQNRQLVTTMAALNDRFESELLRIKIEDFNMPFAAMVGLIIKVALASIPALVILTILIGATWALSIAFFAALLGAG